MSHCIFAAPMTVTQGQLYKTFLKWGHIFQVEFEITVHALPTDNNLANVFHFTQNSDNSAYGDRIPALWIYKSGYFKICSAVNGKRNYCIWSKFDLDEKYHFLIQQYVMNGKIMYKIEKNGQSIASFENKMAQDFNNVKVYISDPWYKPFTSDYGLLENFKISNPIGEYQLQIRH